MLSFAEAYDPLWEARVYRDGVKVETVKSVLLCDKRILDQRNRQPPVQIQTAGLVRDRVDDFWINLYWLYRLPLLRLEKGDGWAEKVEKMVKEIRKKLLIWKIGK